MQHIGTLHKSSSSRLASWMQKGFLAGVILSIALILFGQAVFARTSIISIAGACAILVIYGLAGGLGVLSTNRLNPDILHLASLFGLAIGIVYGGEMLLEYAILPGDNTLLGTLEYGLVLCLLFVSAMVAGLKTGSVRLAILTAVWTATIGSLVWLIVLLVTTFAFWATPQQAQVLRAEGAYDDFARSGMASFAVFVMEDYLGAAFFHLLLGPLIAALLGGVGGLLGKGIRRLRQR